GGPCTGRHCSPQRAFRFCATKRRYKVEKRATKYVVKQLRAPVATVLLSDVSGFVPPKGVTKSKSAPRRTWSRRSVHRSPLFSSATFSVLCHQKALQSRTVRHALPG